jgi:hypothetical protein
VSALGACRELGPGSVHRAIAAAQRQFFDPPALDARDNDWQPDKRRSAQR